MLAAAGLRGAGSRRLMAAFYLHGALISGPAAPPRPRQLSDVARQPPPPPPLAGGLWPRSMSTFPHIKPQVRICAIGHAEHGKTTLAAAIAKVMSDKGRSNVSFLEEMNRALAEKSRGITLTTAPLEFETAKRRYAHVDCPGNGEYVKYMVTQSAQMAGGILVVSAVDGPMPQTKEHLLHARQVGLHPLICFLNKVDLCPELVEIAEWKVRDLLSACKFPGDEIPVIRGSALSALNGTNYAYGTSAILELMDVLDSYIPDPMSKFHHLDFSQGNQVGAPAYVLNENQIAMLVDRAIDVCSDRIAEKALQKVASGAIMHDPLVHKLVDACADKIAAKNSGVLQTAVADITAVIDDKHKSLEAAAELQLSGIRMLSNIGKGVLALLSVILSLIVYCLYALWAKADEIANSALGRAVKFVLSLFGGKSS